MRWCGTYGVAAGAVLLVACQEKALDRGQESKTEPAPTNRIHVTADVIANLGITFAEVRRERLCTWLTVPGRLEVPDSHRWTVRAPAAGRVTVECRRWEEVEAGGRVGELVSPELLATQQALLEAEQAQRRSGPYLRAGRERLRESEEYLAEAQRAEAAARERVAEVSALAGGLSNKELVEVHRQYAAAQAVALEAALRRDELIVRVGELELRAEQADLAFRQHLRALSVLTGLSEARLRRGDQGREAWQTTLSIELRSPGAGRITMVHASTGERVAVGVPVVDVVDTRELVFRGQLPEGDLGMLPNEARVMVEPASSDIAPIETHLAGPLPVANEVARTVRIEAPVPNADRRLPHGFSAVARVLSSESPHEENVVPRASVVMDGLEAILLVRDPGHPDEVVRTPVVLGRRDRDSVEVLSGVLAGDEVVLAGALQLVEAMSSQAVPSGHFHADGTFHGDHK